VAALMRLKQMGFTPFSVLDIGAYEGKWSVETARIFPAAKYILYEALEQKRAILKYNTQSLNSSIHICLLGPNNSEDVPYFAMESGSGVLPELSEIQRSEIMLPMRRLDSVVSEEIKGPLLMKLDVQGYEIDVLAGAGRLLDMVEVIVMECSVVPYNAQAPLVVATLVAMDRLGFILFDIAELHRKVSDQALLQVDLVFVKQQGRWARMAADLSGNLAVFEV
jgi:FkbM family methyltransferase